MEALEKVQVAKTISDSEANPEIPNGNQTAKMNLHFATSFHGWFYSTANLKKHCIK